MRQPSACFSTSGSPLRWLAMVTILITFGCYTEPPDPSLPTQEYPPHPQSPFECRVEGGWKSVTTATEVQIDVCTDHQFEVAMPLAERVSSSPETAWIIEVDSKGTPCSTYPNWSVDVTGSSINIQLYASPATAQFPGVMCIQVLQPYMLRFRIPNLAAGSYKINVDDEIRDEHETATINVPAREIQVVF